MLMVKKFNMNKLKQLYKWIANDGLLHILICIVLMLSLQPIIGYLLSAIITFFFSSYKEYYDSEIQKDNNKKQVIHDLICDIIGVIIASLIILLWQLV